METFVNQGASYTMRTLPADRTAEICGFEPIIQLWHSRRHDDGLPCRSAFEFADFTGWMGSLAISERDGDDFRFRLYGEKFRELLGVELTGQLLCGSLCPELIMPTKRHFRLLFDGPCIGHTEGNVPIPDRGFKSFDVLDLPIRMNVGNDALLHVLGAVD
jgi:hypothetical protein